ncbi:MAG: alpha/beta fold hydrolase [Cellvibrio sp.]|uniref:YheT family hydrolase n=1 Tax=Cellvibrio sp. TaxID=1965322 RepID=UPI0031A4989A
MPVIYSEFRSPWWMFNGDLQTQLPVLLRRVKLASESLVIPTTDGDELSANLYCSASERKKTLLILTHGLEGSNKQHYILGMAKAALESGVAGADVDVDVLAWNLRGCGSPSNNTEKLYFAGGSQDFDAVVVWAESNGYDNIYLAAYSLGGNIVLKWLGEQGVSARARGIKAVCVASVPIDLKACVTTLDRWRNMVYRLYFVTSMKWRLRRKAVQFFGKVDLSRYHQVNSFYSYDEIYSAPLNGFASVDKVHAAASAKYYLDKIDVPCLLVTAKNDPFLNSDCIPLSLAEQHQMLTLEITNSGGHVGFLDNQREWWLDTRFLNFFKSLS